ncbi:MAG: TIGR04283 family arsenosugar biosynthesis glycosyltransferase [Alphaproteobacteria bacterium]|nr:TIGR04283 family arsenosugar biosynthesis glycosyltransferase [Alphaproteobacteria bacterium]
MRVSVVIPTLNAGHSLSATVTALETGPDHGVDIELVVVDGGSTDGTVETARTLGARLVHAKRGRGSQLRTGGFRAAGPWLLFLHADTRLGAGWPRDVADLARTPQRAGWFRFALDDDSARARRLERLVHWRSRRLGLPYGDQGLVIHRDLYHRLGGYPDIPLMEDVALVRRIGRARLVGLPTPAVTSAARYRRDGYLLRSIRNLLCLSLYGLGVPPRRIARLYGRSGE